jgi:hypothetical protein
MESSNEQVQASIIQLNLEREELLKALQADSLLEMRYATKSWGTKRDQKETDD